MASYEGRRSFLLGITLNELSFIMFFLLMIISTATLQNTKKELQQAQQQKAELQVALAQANNNQETFKRLQLLESRLMQAAGLAMRPTEQQLAELFTRLRAAENSDDLQREIDNLQQYKKLSSALEHYKIKTSPAALQELLQQIENSEQEQQRLKGQLAYMHKKFQANGLDHPPCWADSKTGAVEYLYTMTLYENLIDIKPAWPVYRKADLKKIPGATALAGKTLTLQQLEQQVKSIFSWSKLHECRHFVRIKDVKGTSKAAFKRQMLAIENYFYKYLQR